MFTSTSVQEIIDRARIRHWSFADVVLGDGAVLTYLSQRLRTHLAMHGAKIEGMVNTTMTYAIASVNGLLIATDPVTHVPQVTTTYQDGWPIHVDPITHIPYYDTTEPMIAVDPYGLHGGTPGFPLPSEMVRLVDVSLVYSQPPGMIIPCDVIREHGRIEAQPGRNPQVFVSGNRLVPLLAFTGGQATNSSDRWFTVSSLIMSYVGLPTLTRLADTLNIPGVLVEALDADAALFLSRQSKAVTAAERAGFAADVATVAAVIATAALEMLNEPQVGSVEYRG